MTATVRTKLGEIDKEGGIITLEETNSNTRLESRPVEVSMLFRGRGELLISFRLCYN